MQGVAIDTEHIYDYKTPTRMVENIYGTRWKNKVRIQVGKPSEWVFAKVLVGILHLGEGESTGEGGVFISINLPVRSITSLPLIFR